MVNTTETTISFGQTGASDFTKHKDNERTDAYINRNKKHEYWTTSGVKAAGWMSKHILWNRPTLQTRVADINNTIKTYKRQHYTCLCQNKFEH